MHLRISRDFDMEEAIVLAADVFDEVARVVELAVAGHARGQVAAQRDDAPAAHRLVAVEQLADLRARAADAGQVRRGIEAVFLAQMAHGFRRVAQRGSARAERAAHVFGLEHWVYHSRRHQSNADLGCLS